MTPTVRKSGKLILFLNLKKKKINKGGLLSVLCPESVEKAVIENLICGLTHLEYRRQKAKYRQKKMIPVFKSCDWGWDKVSIVSDEIKIHVDNYLCSFIGAYKRLGKNCKNFAAILLA